MSTGEDLHSSIEPYLDHAISGRTSAAVRLTLDLVDAGISIESIVVDMLAAAQHSHPPPPGVTLDSRGLRGRTRTLSSKSVSDCAQLTIHVVRSADKTLTGRPLRSLAAVLTLRNSAPVAADPLGRTCLDLGR